MEKIEAGPIVSEHYLREEDLQEINNEESGFSLNLTNIHSGHNLHAMNEVICHTRHTRMNIVLS